MSRKQAYSFVQFLKSLSSKDDRAALASLRRGLGREPGTTPDVYRVVGSRTARLLEWEERWYHLIASLYALHPEGTEQDANMGAHFAQAVDPTSDNKDAVERRFTTLLNAHVDDLPFYLRQAISFLKAKEVHVNWCNLLVDVLFWDDEEMTVQRKWARQFWGRMADHEQS